VIKVSALTKEFPAGRHDTPVLAVDNVSFDVPKGEFFTLLGPSGCGKTTTLRCVAGLERPSSGQIELGETVVVSDHVYVPTHQRDIGMVFQGYAVWPHLTVFENAAFPLRVGKKKVPKAQIPGRVRETLELVGLGGLEKRKPTQLSGGQQQRLSLARALVHQPDNLLLDEPLSNLDAKLRERMRGELSEIQRTLGFTALYVTHDQAEALSLSDEIAVMNHGRILQRGTPWDIYYHPARRFVAEFMGSTNLLQGRVLEQPDDSGLVRVDTPLGVLRCSTPAGLLMQPPQPVMVGLRAEELELRRSGQSLDRGVNLLPGTVAGRSFGGSTTEYQVRLANGGQLLRIEGSSRLGLRPGDEVTLVIDPQACHVLPDDEPAHTVVSAPRSEGQGVG
jgi:iron(III) transport system ATP-binding protein